MELLNLANAKSQSLKKLKKLKIKIPDVSAKFIKIIDTLSFLFAKSENIDNLSLNLS